MLSFQSSLDVKRKDTNSGSRIYIYTHTLDALSAINNRERVVMGGGVVKVVIL